LNYARSFIYAFHYKKFLIVCKEKILKDGC